MKAKEFDKRFDDGKDITEYLDLSKANRLNQEQKKGTYRFPSLDDSKIG